MSKRTVPLVLVACLAAVTSWAADNPFVGKWKLNTAKSKIIDQMKVESVGANKYAFDFGGGAETIVADGTDQPVKYGTNLSVTVVGSDSWKVVRKKDGRMLLTANWKLSKDGNTLTDEFTSVESNGSTSTVNYVYGRTAGRSGFAGTWETTQVNSTYEIQIQSYEEGGLSIIDASDKVTKNIKFDGKDYPAVGANVPTGFASSVRRVNGRTLEMTDKINGKIRDTQQIELSPDLKTLTMTVRRVDKDKPNILVFDRE